MLVGLGAVSTTFIAGVLAVRKRLDQLIIVLIGVVVTACLWGAYRYTRFGMATTAVSGAAPAADWPKALSPNLVLSSPIFRKSHLPPHTPKRSRTA